MGRHIKKTEKAPVKHHGIGFPHSLRIGRVAATRRRHGVVDTAKAKGLRERGKRIKSRAMIKSAARLARYGGKKRKWRICISTMAHKSLPTTSISYINHMLKYICFSSSGI